MNRYNLKEINELSKSFNYNRDSLEKVLRLSKVLKFFNEHAELNGKYILKGGTAINLCLFDFPRLSVDIDLDYSENIKKEDLRVIRQFHNKIINENMAMMGYQVSPKSRYSYTLDSYILQYTNAVGNIDNIQVEINYSNRAHIFTPKQYKMNSSIVKNINILGLDKIELYGSKIAALIGRTTARDIFDVSEMIKHQVIREEEEDMLRKTILFYLLLSNNFEPLQVLLTNFEENIQEIDFRNIRRNLIPVLKVGTNISVEFMKERVVNYVNRLLMLTEKEERYIEFYNQGKYLPSLLFNEDSIIKRIKDHPMAMWKMINYQKHSNGS